ncbi:MAG TPA: acetylxylan esterase [Pirellulaceae bacterium]|nr:acetylxylan esterase [Pirellulaceae bacterium]
MISLSHAALASAADFPPPDALKSNTSLPDPLVMRDGTKVESREDWEAKRKPELKALFQHYMYGLIPPKPVRQEFQTGEPRDCLEGKATLREITIHSLEPRTGHPLHVLLIAPKGVERPPVFVGMNFCGNHTLLDDPKVPLPTGWVRNSCVGALNERATDKGRGSQKDVWNADLIVSRGYALATFYSGDVDPDTPDLADGIGPTYFKGTSESPAGDDPGTIALWSWGFRRVVDYLTEGGGKELVDPQRIAVVGHSRNGKTALLAGAFDERIALIIPHQAGCGGTAPSRTDDPKAESVKRINTSFPHWFCENFVLFNDDVARLPFDQHCLLALCAPRPVLYSNAQDDQWANPNGQFEMLRAAEPVYKLYGVEGLAPDARPEIGKLVKSRLGYFLREGKHSMSREDWEVFLDYVDANLKGR